MIFRLKNSKTKQPKILTLERKETDEVKVTVPPLLPGELLGYCSRNSNKALCAPNQGDRLRTREAKTARVRRCQYRKEIYEEFYWKYQCRCAKKLPKEGKE